MVGVFKSLQGKDPQKTIDSHTFDAVNFQSLTIGSDIKIIW